MLRVEGLTKSFRGVPAVNGLSFSLDGGTLLALVGPNGAGKSTTLMCLAGLMRPDAGAISWSGTPLGDERIRIITLVHETPFVFEMLTVWEHLLFVARSMRRPPGWQQEALDLLERFDLSPERDKLGAELSKGMRQKLLVACAVMAKAPVLMLDEPMIGLDPRGQVELRKVLDEVRREGTAVLVSSHQLGQVQEFADQLLVINKGRTVLEAPMAEVLAKHGSKSLEEIFLDITA